MVTTAVVLDSSNIAHVADPQEDKWAPPIVLHFLGFLNDTSSNSLCIALEG
jgi:hypothetical protein